MNLLHELSQFTGTENWYRHPLVPKVTYTDGVKFFAEKAGAYWLLDIIATELVPHVEREEFIHVKAASKNDKAELTADDGNDNVVWHRSIEWTDLPEGEWSLYFCPGGPRGTHVILLPGEY